MSKLYEAIKDYLDEYEFRGDGGDYTPNENERALIEDAIYGMITDLEEKGLAIFPADHNDAILSVTDGRSVEYVRRS